VLSGPQLDAAIRQVVSRPKRDLFFRATLLKHANDPLGKQRPIRANRFNVANGARVLYLAETIHTALNEVQAFGFPARAVAIVGVQFDLQAVVDLRDANTLTTLQLTINDLSVNFRTVPPGAAPAPTQELGERAAASGAVDGFIFESVARPGTINLAVLEANLGSLNSSLTVDDPTNNLHDTLP
jgi:RES domain-containing protein